MTITVDIETIKNNVWQKIVDLEILQKKNDPGIAGHLKAIHANLSQYEELNHLLTDEQIRTIVESQKQVTGTMLTTAVVKTSKPSLLKQARGIGADDL